MLFYIFLEVNYQKKITTNPGKAKSEGRLQPAMIGAVLLPIGPFWFAWSTYPQVHWIVSILGGAIFGFGQVLLYISLINYVVDAYTVYAASALAANAILRVCSPPLCEFSPTPHGPISSSPLFTPYMYQNLGNQWASSIPAFLALACTPLSSICTATPSGREAKLELRRKTSLRPC